MADPYVGEIRLFAGNFAPVSWALCNGQLLGISDNQVLFTLIGTTYGGDGVSTFAVPDLRGRVPVCQGQSYPVGQTGGVETVTLTAPQMPAHSHVASAAAVAGTSGSPAGNVWANAVERTYSTDAPDSTIAPDALAPAGGGQPHDNMTPFLALNFIIACSGIFPSKS